MKTIVKKQHNYNAIILMCIMACTMALRSVIGDYKNILESNVEVEI